MTVAEAEKLDLSSEFQGLQSSFHAEHVKDVNDLLSFAAISEQLVMQNCKVSILNCDRVAFK